MQNINSHEMCLSPLDKRPELGLGRRMEQLHGRDCLMVRILFEKESQHCSQELLYLKEKRRKIR